MFRRGRIDPKLAIVSLAIAAGLVLIGYGVVISVTGDEVTKLPSAIESINPVPDAVQVPSQSSIIVDLASGFTGTLEIDGVLYATEDPDRGRNAATAEPPAPGQQVDIPAGVRYERGNYTLTFTPGDEVGFDEFPVGNHSVRVTYWKLEDEVNGQPANERSYFWTFNIV